MNARNPRNEISTLRLLSWSSFSGGRPEVRSDCPCAKCALIFSTMLPSPKEAANDFSAGELTPGRARKCWFLRQHRSERLRSCRLRLEVGYPGHPVDGSSGPERSVLAW